MTFVKFAPKNPCTIMTAGLKRKRLGTNESFIRINLRGLPSLQAMNKQSLVELVHSKVGGTKVQAEEVVEGIIEAVTGSLKKGDEVSIAGLGIFSVKTRAARMARNPKTGEQVKVAATRVPRFRPAKALKDAVK